MNYLFHVLIFISIFLRVKGAGFDRYSGKKVDVLQSTGLQKQNVTEVCSIDVKPCTPHEGSRIDGTCNNFKEPTKGSAKGPYLRLLSPDYGDDKKGIRKSKTGAPLPSARKVRTSLQTTGQVDDKHSFTIALPHYLEFILRDVSSLNRPRDLLRKRQHCCQPEAAADRRCSPIPVPDDDPYLKVTDIRCLNFSRAETFQDAGCAPDTIAPEQINFQTPLLDLSTIYGVNEKALDLVRVYEHGLLKLDKRQERFVPLNILATTAINNVSNPDTNATEPKKNTLDLSLYDKLTMLNTESHNNTTNDIYFQNKPNGTIFYKFGFSEAGNYGLRTTTLAIFFMREHNRLARELRRLNPCWKDDRLFKVARQINIATAANIFLYELLPLILGYDNMVNYGLLSYRVEQLTSYYDDQVPLVYAEFDIATRYFHTLMDGRIKRYNEHYQLLGEFPLGETLHKQEIIEQNKNFEEINRGTFYQPAAKADDIQDPEISEKFYGDLQRAHDLAAIDIQTGRDLGVRGYNDYRHLCGLKAAKKFEDFSDVMEMEKILELKKLYVDIEDIDLLAGIMSEIHIKGTAVGPTLFCIMAKQLQLWRFSDRFWFERGDQLHSFNLAQLNEIRRTTMARLACDNAEAIKNIQPQAFVHVRHGNTPVPCAHIFKPDLTKWEDSSCQNLHNRLFAYSWSHTKSDRKKVDVSQFSTKQNEESGRNRGNLEPRNMVVDYSTFFDTLLSYKPQGQSRALF